MRITRFLCTAAAAVALFVSAGSAQAALIIDNYDVGPQTIMISAGSSSDTVGGLAPDVLGGEREVTLTIVSNPLNLTATAAVIAPPGLFTLSNDVLVDSTSTALYNGAGNAGLGGVDLAAAGTRFEFDVQQVDLTLSITIQVTDTMGNTSSLTRSGLVAGPEYFNFANFVGTADFSDVNAILVTWNAPNSADFAADFFSVTGNVIPEPASVALLATGLVGLVARRRLRAAK